MADLQVPLKPSAEPNTCTRAVEEKVDKEGGEPVYGWQVSNHGELNELSAHCVWRKPSGELLDITPQLLDLGEGWCAVKLPEFTLFRPDEAAKPSGQKPNR